MRPITIGGFSLSATGVEVKGRPSFDDYVGALAFAEGAHKASGWWLADLLRYGGTRGDWADRLSQAEHSTGLREKTLKNVRAIGAIEKTIRREDVEFSLHGEVASLPPEEQINWLRRAADEGWSQRELRVEIRAAKRSAIIEGQAVLKGMYRVILADPPWIYSDSGPTKDGSLGKVERHYKGMTMDDLAKLPVKAHAMEDSILFCWVTATMLYENPGPREVIEAWGFTPKTGLVWNKVLGMPGHYANHVTHEHVIIATRGSCMPDVGTPQDPSIFVERRKDEHSSKPECLRRWIEQHWTRGPYLELFGRRNVPNWNVFGNDARLWDQEASA